MIADSFGYPIIDAHAHIGYSQDGYKLTVEEQIKRMDELGIEVMIASNLSAMYHDPIIGNREMLRVIQQYPKRIKGYVCINPHYNENTEQYLDEILSIEGFIGIKLHPDFNSYPPDGEKYRRIYQYANKKNAVVLNHSFGDYKMIVSLALEYPNMKMICGHRCAYASEEEVAYYKKNILNRKDIYFDTTSSCVGYGAIERYAEAVGAEHIIFGTDSPYFDPAFQVGRFIHCRLSDSQRQVILRENAASIIFS